MYKKLAIIPLAILGFTSCSNDDDNTILPELENEVVAPVTYEFERNDETTISFSGQTTRILMAEELANALKDPSFTMAQLNAMYNHVEGNADFADAELNSSDKVLRSKTAASFDFFAGTANSEVIADFEGWINEQANDVFPVWSQEASAGVAGGIQEAGGGSTRYVNAKGLELNQAVAKSLIGALMLDQILNNYISPNVLTPFEAANDAETLIEGKNYTDMEHDWDEAFGYLFGNTTSVATPLDDLGSADNFLNKYLGRVEGDTDFEGIAQDVFDALKLGRAAIVAKNYDVRNEQAEIIREKLSEVIGVRAVYYLQQAKTVLADENPDYASAFHDLSEAYGFIYSLQFTRAVGVNSIEPYLSRTEVETVLGNIFGNLANGFWEVSGEALDNASNTIADKFDFTVAQAAN